MSGKISLPQAGLALRVWRDDLVWQNAADCLAILVALSLPWSTSLVAIFIGLFVFALIPRFDLVTFGRLLKHPACWLPVVFLGLAVVGTLWATDIPWSARLHGVNPAAKLLAIPLLIYHFERSSRGLWVAVAFLASCVAIMLMSWLTFADPRFIFDPSKIPGVPVKNYIAQSQEFALCMFAAIGAGILSLREGRTRLGVALICIAFLFLANMVFVISSRTVLVCIPILLVILAVRYFSRTEVVLVVIAASLIAALSWNASPSLRERLLNVAQEYKQYRDTNAVTSTGQRLEYWRKSMAFIERSPVFGNGTGSTKALFEQAAIGQTGVSAEVIGNPHNQTLNVAVQWGVLGCIILYAMWAAHFLLFQEGGLAAWIGLVAVVENVVSSLFNSHIFDFHEGWIYVLAVGLAGGMMRREQAVARAIEARAEGAR